MTKEESYRQIAAYYLARWINNEFPTRKEFDQVDRESDKIINQDWSSQVIERAVV